VNKKNNRKTSMTTKVALTLFCILLQTACSSDLIVNPTLTPTATAQATSTQPASTSTPIVTPTAELWGSQSYSTDQEWIASIYKSSENDQYFMTLVVEKRDHSRKWIVGKISTDKTKVVAEYPSPFHWSSDGKTLYFTHQGFQDGCFSYAAGGKGLFSLDLATGKVRTILHEFASQMKFSPDESMLAFVDYGRTGLQVLDVATGDKIEFEHLYPDLLTNQYGLVWSPNNDQVAFTILLEACITDKATSIVIADIASMSQKILVKEDERHLGSEEWLEESRILVSDWSENSWYLNPKTGELTSIGQ
jgi:hypothetical protein